MSNLPRVKPNPEPELEILKRAKLRCLFSETPEIYP